MSHVSCVASEITAWIGGLEVDSRPIIGTLSTNLDDESNLTMELLERPAGVRRKRCRRDLRSKPEPRRVLLGSGFLVTVAAFGRPRI